MAIILLVVIIVFLLYFFVDFSKKREDIKWGVNFSQMHTENLGLEWKELYTEILDDLKAREIKIGTHWNMLEPEKENYNFDDLDWQIEEAEKRGAKILLVLGIKTPRWPECHIPQWVKEDELEKRALDFIETAILRYRESSAIWAWQIENEPFFEFGHCPKMSDDFLAKEITLVKTIDDKKRPVIISDTGEMSFWFKPAKLADVVGITMYKKVWSTEIKRYVSYFIPAAFYSKRADLIKRVFGKEVICVELQAEPWGQKLLYDSPLDEQKKTMNLEQFRKNIEFAQKTKLSKFYLWGTEWWYWMKKVHNNSEIWDEAKKLF